MRKVVLFLALAGATLLLVSFVPWPDRVGDAPAAAEAGATDAAAQGAALFRAKGCVSCHRHAAVDDAWGTAGPELTAYEADAAFLRRWLRDPAAVRPNTLMPNLALAEAEIEALIAFLESDAGTSETTE